MVIDVGSGSTENNNSEVAVKTKSKVTELELPTVTASAATKVIVVPLIPWTLPTKEDPKKQEEPTKIPVTSVTVIVVATPTFPPTPTVLIKELEGELNTILLDVEYFADIILSAAVPLLIKPGPALTLDTKGTVSKWNGSFVMAADFTWFPTELISAIITKSSWATVVAPMSPFASITLKSLTLAFIKTKATLAGINVVIVHV